MARRGDPSRQSVEHHHAGRALIERLALGIRCPQRHHRLTGDIHDGRHGGRYPLIGHGVRNLLRGGAAARCHVEGVVALDGCGVRSAGSAVDGLAHYLVGRIGIRRAVTLHCPHQGRDGVDDAVAGGGFVLDIEVEAGGGIGTTIHHQIAGSAVELETAGVVGDGHAVGAGQAAAGVVVGINGHTREVAVDGRPGGCPVYHYRRHTADAVEDGIRGAVAERILDVAVEAGQRNMGPMGSIHGLHRILEGQRVAAAAAVIGRSTGITADGQGKRRLASLGHRHRLTEMDGKSQTVWRGPCAIGTRGRGIHGRDDGGFGIYPETGATRHRAGITSQIGKAAGGHTYRHGSVLGIDGRCVDGRVMGRVHLGEPAQAAGFGADVPQTEGSIHVFAEAETQGGGFARLDACVVGCDCHRRGLGIHRQAQCGRGAACISAPVGDCGGQAGNTLGQGGSGDLHIADRDICRRQDYAANRIRAAEEIDGIPGHHSRAIVRVGGEVDAHRRGVVAGEVVAD